MRAPRSYWDEEGGLDDGKTAVQLHEQIADGWTGLLDADGRKLMRQPPPSRLHAGAEE